MDRQRLDQWLERAILALLFGVIVFAPLATGAVRTIDFLVVQVATVVLVSLWLGRLWLGAGHRFYWAPACWGVVVFMGYAAYRYFTADIEYVARQEVIQVMVYGCLFFVALNNLTRKEHFTALAVTLVVLAALISIYAIFQWGGKSDRVWTFVRPSTYGHRGSGTFINPNHLAGFLEMVLPLGLALTLMGRGGSMFKIVLGYASLVIAAGLAVTVSRAGWLAAAVGLALLLAFQVRYRFFRIPALLAAGAVMIGAVVFFGNSFAVRNRVEEATVITKDSSAGFRLMMWSGAVGMWKESPRTMWLGVGPGHYDERFRQYRPPLMQNRPMWAHNDYLNTLADWGITGLAIIGAMLVLLLAGVLRTWKYVNRGSADLVKRDQDRSAHLSDRAAVVLGAATGLVAILCHSTLDFNMHIPANALLAVLLMAVLGSHLRFATDRHWVGTRTVSAAITLVGVVLIAAFVVDGWRRGQEVLWLRAAGRATDREAKVTALGRAFEVEPRNFETAYNIGEELRRESWEGRDDYEKLAESAITWFQAAVDQNRYHVYSLLHLGMCFDWVKKPEEAEKYFDRAALLDPNGYYAAALRGWHVFHKGNFDEAKKLFLRSVELTPYGQPNPIASSYLTLIERRSNEPPSPLWKR